MGRRSSSFPAHGAWYIGRPYRIALLRRILDHLRHDWKRIRTKDSFARNAFTVFGGNSVVLLSQIILTPVIARIYGPDAYGIYGLFLALVLNLSSFADLGYSNAYVLPKEDHRFMHLFRLNLTLLGIMVLLASTVALFREKLYDLIPDWRPLGDHIWLVPVSLTTFSLAVFFTQWFTRMRAFSTSVYIGSTTTVSLRLFNMGYGAFAKGGSHGLIIGDAIVNGLAVFAYVIAMLKYGIRRLFADWSWKGIKELAVEYKRYPLLTFPERWVTLLGMQLPVLLLSGDLRIVGQFALSSSLLLIPLRLLGYSFSTVFIQKAAETVDSDPELLGRITQGLYQRLFWVGLAPFTAMVFFSDVVFSVVLGEAWHDAGVITAYMGLFFYFRLLSEPMMAVFYAQRREHLLLVFQTVLTLARIAVMGPMLYWGASSGAIILAFSIVSALGYLVLGYLLLKATGRPAITLTARSLGITALACILFSALRYATLGDPWPSL